MESSSSESASRGTDATGVGAPQAPVNTVFEMSNEDLASASIDEGGKVGGEGLGPAIDEGLGWALESLSSPLLEAGATTPRHEDVALATVKAFPHQEKYTNTGTFFNEVSQFAVGHGFTGRRSGGACSSYAEKNHSSMKAIAGDDPKRSLEQNIIDVMHRTYGRFFQMQQSKDLWKVNTASDIDNMVGNEHGD
mmetsp:Transcript_29754/g.70725  ORF Transcript_29754/g.70725 Transcript_29754/m.70725 type:complete len:193 (-) Transcript_29754:33-611(-)